MGRRYLYIDKKQRIKIEGELPRRASRINEEFKKSNLEADFCYFDSIEIKLEAGMIEILANGRNIKDYSHILFGGHATKTQYEIKQFIVDYIEKTSSASRPLVQNAKAIKKVPYYNKLYMAKFFIENSIPHLKGYYSAGDLKFPLPIEYPVIVKSLDGINQIQLIGKRELIKKDIYKISSDEEWLDSRTIKARVANYFIQEFSDAGEDFRLFVSKGRFIGGWRRKASENSFLTVGKESTYSYYNQASTQLKQLVEDVANKFEADFIAVDIIFKDRKPYVLEISLNPGFHAYENKCGTGKPVNIASAIINSFCES